MFEDLLEADGGVEHEDRPHLGGQRVEQAADERRLARADLAHQQHEAVALPAPAGRPPPPLPGPTPPPSSMRPARSEIPPATAPSAASTAGSRCRKRGSGVMRKGASPRPKNARYMECSDLERALEPDRGDEVVVAQAVVVQGEDG